MPTIKIAIIGAGPRGLTVLERLIANERATKSADLTVYLFDSNTPGVGCHDPDQSDALLVNTVAGQITMFSDASVVGAGPAMEGPSFFQWLEKNPTRKFDTISADAYYSRGLFGRYLNWVYQHLCSLAPPHVNIQFINSAVARAERLPNYSWSLATDNASYQANFLFLTTGHTKPAGLAAQALTSSNGFPCETTVVSDPYPVRERLSFVRADMTIGVEGMGLTTFDVLSELTVGRGGRFITEASGAMRYVRSGNEPRIITFSRSGLPLTARARNQKGVSLQYKPRFLFAEKVRAMRAVRKLDFVADVFPLLLADMEFAYYEAYLRQHGDPVQTMLFINQFVCADAGERQRLVRQYIPGRDRFSWARQADPVPDAALLDRETFGHWLRAHLNQDLAEAKRGNLDSPLKAASDVLRDLRDNLRAAIDHAGLTEASHRWLLTEFLPVMNRMAVGPPASRIAEMLALMDAGVLTADWGPGTRCELPPEGGLIRVSSAKWPELSEPLHGLIKARISLHSPKDDASPLLQGLLAGGHVRLFQNGGFHPGGIEIDGNFNWVSKTGQAVSNAWALGIPTEGVKFYTFVVPRGGVNSTAIVDAGRAVGRMLALIDGRSLPAVPAIAPETTYDEPRSAFATIYGALS